MYVLVLGLDVLGNPFGLVRGLAEGIEDLFYEPYQVTFFHILFQAVDKKKYAYTSLHTIVKYYPYIHIRDRSICIDNNTYTPYYTIDMLNPFRKGTVFIRRILTS